MINNLPASPLHPLQVINRMQGHFAAIIATTREEAAIASYIYWVGRYEEVHPAIQSKGTHGFYSFQDDLIHSVKRFGKAVVYIRHAFHPRFADHGMYIGWDQGRQGIIELIKERDETMLSPVEYLRRCGMKFHAGGFFSNKPRITLAEWQALAKQK